LDESRRIDQPVAVRVLYEVAAATVRFWRVESVVEDARRELYGKLPHRIGGGMLIGSADRRGRARGQRAIRGAPPGVVARLKLDEGILPRFAERRGRNLPARVAIDTGAIDEKLARHVLGHAE